MRLYLKTKLKKHFLRYGYNLEGFPRPSSFHKTIEGKLLSTKRKGRLKNYASQLARVDDHKLYNELLNSFVPEWKLTFEKTEFIGKGEGGGGSTLDTFRKVQVDGIYYMEKIYLNYSRDTKAVQWFQEDLYDLVHCDTIKVPRIEMVFKGEIMTIVYYKFFDLASLSMSGAEKELIGVSKKLYQFFDEDEVRRLSPIIPQYLSDFELNSKYKVYFEEDFINGGIDLNVLKPAIKQSKHVLTHGSLHVDNAYNHNVLIDWWMC